MFLQRPVRGQAAGKPKNPVRDESRPNGSGNEAFDYSFFSSFCLRVQVVSLHCDVSSSVNRALCNPVPPDESSLAVGGTRRFPMFGEGCPSVLSYMDENGLEQDEGTSEVTCM